MKLSEAVKILSDAKIDSARYDAIELFSHFEGVSRAQLVIGDYNSDCAELELAVMRRAERYPLQYIIGKVGFYREEYFVDENCLIPRADTEVLVDYAVKNIPSGARFIDLCTGSGCIGISVLKNTDATEAVLADISSDACELALKNAEHNGVLDRVDVRRLDVLRDIPDGEFFAVLSNPPYVADEVYNGLEREIFHEPKIAFVGGSDGGDFYRRLTPIYKEKIEKDGFIAYEIGYDQRKLIEKIADECGMRCEIVKDSSENDRLAILML